LVELGTQLAFEVEEVTGGFARSVVVSGTARRLPDDQAERAELTS
jgi:nitroimidazol reductase NimA-like FMN-containing flavoprotein (pyridoxamine 5'-phosphate oxidase superfamily)